MEQKNSDVLVQNIVTAGKSHIEACLQEDIPVICINRETRKNKTMPFRALYDNDNQFWQKNETWEFFLSHEDIKKIEEKVNKHNAKWAPAMRGVGSAMTDAQDNPLQNGFGDEYEKFSSMPEAERCQCVEAGKNRLNTLITKKPKQKEVVTEALVETAQDTILCNHISLLNALNLSGDDAKKQTQHLVDSTRDLVQASSQLISANIFHDDLINTLVSKSNGTIIQHMTRVYLKGLAFLSCYNKLVSSSNIIMKLRITFPQKYQAFYNALLPHFHPDDITLEKVFLGGMRAIPEHTFFNWAVGFLVHDVGKAAAVEYHEGEASYNRDIVMDHVKVGYNSIVQKTNYPPDAGLIAGYHHEYYGDAAGYGFFRTNLEQHKKANPQLRQDHCIAYEVEPMLKFEALAFFPAKVLEIVDIFDSITDPNRKYRKPMTTEEALIMMKEEFINKHPKIDYILFDLFEKFVTVKAS